MALHNYFFEEYWNIGVIDKPIEKILSDPDFFQDVKTVSTPKEFFYADPFWNESVQDPKVFCEKFLFAEQTGQIVELTIQENSVTNEKATLANNSHFSFPFILNDAGENMMIPENSESGSLMAYDLSGNKKKIVIDKPLVDAVIVLHNNLYWLFGTILDQDENKSLQLYYADKLEDHWIEHPANPITNSYNGARMAGKIIQHNYKLYRLGQLCKPQYGSGIRLFEITQLNKTSFEEQAIKDILPPEPYKGIHSLNPYGSKTLVDLKTIRFSPLKPIRRIRRKYF